MTHFYCPLDTSSWKGRPTYLLTTYTLSDALVLLWCVCTRSLSGVIKMCVCVCQWERERDSQSVCSLHLLLLCSCSFNCVHLRSFFLLECRLFIIRQFPGFGHSLISQALWATIRILGGFFVVVFFVVFAKGALEYLWLHTQTKTTHDSHIQSRSLITKSDITNSGYNEAQKLIPAKILLYMNRNVSVIANSGYNGILVITNWFCYPQWTIMPLVTNQPLITNHMLGPCEKFKLDITKWLPSVREPFLKNGW